MLYYVKTLFVKIVSKLKFLLIQFWQKNILYMPENILKTSFDCNQSEKFVQIACTLHWKDLPAVLREWSWMFLCQADLKHRRHVFRVFWWCKWGLFHAFVSLQRRLSHWSPPLRSELPQCCYRPRAAAPSSPLPFLPRVCGHPPLVGRNWWNLHPLSPKQKPGASFSVSQNTNGYLWLL